MGIWSDLWTGGGGITQDLYNEKFNPQPSYEPTPPTPEVYTPPDYSPSTYQPTYQPPQDEFANWEATSTDPAPSWGEAAGTWDVPSAWETDFGEEAGNWTDPFAGWQSSYQPAEEFANFDFFQPETEPSYNWQGPPVPEDHEPFYIWDYRPRWNPEPEFANWEATSTDPALNWGSGSIFAGWASAGQNPFENFTADYNFNYPPNRWEDREFGNFEVENPSLWSMFQKDGPPPPPDLSQPPAPGPVPSPTLGMQFGPQPGLWGSDALTIPPNAFATSTPSDLYNNYGPAPDPFEYDPEPNIPGPDDATARGAGAAFPAEYDYTPAREAPAFEPFIPPEDEFAATMAPYQPRKALPSEPEAFAEWGEAYAQTGPQPTLGWLEQAYAKGPYSPLPPEYREDYWQRVIAQNGWTPDQAQEQIAAAEVPTISDYKAQIEKEIGSFATAYQSLGDRLEHEQLTPEYQSLEDAYAILTGQAPYIASDDGRVRPMTGGYTRAELERMPDEEVYRLAALQQRVASGRESGELGAGLMDVVQQFVEPFSLPGQLSSALMGKFPEAFNTRGYGPADSVPNPLANDALAEEYVAPLVNILVGNAVIPGGVGAFLGAVAPTMQQDTDTGLSAWDQMDWKQRAFVAGNAAVNAGLLTKSSAIENKIAQAFLGGITPEATTAAGIALNAAQPFAAGAVQKWVFGEDTNWQDVAMQAAIWGSARGIHGVVPILRGQRRVDVTNPADFAGFSPEGQPQYFRDQFTEPLSIKQRNLPEYQRRLAAFEEEAETAWLQESYSRLGSVEGEVLWRDDMPATQLLIPKLASEFRGETPPSAMNAIRDVVSEFPEATRSLAVSTKIAAQLADDLAPVEMVPSAAVPTTPSTPLRWEGEAPVTAPFDVGALGGRGARAPQPFEGGGEQVGPPITEMLQPYAGNNQNLVAAQNLVNELQTLPRISKGYTNVTVVDYPFTTPRPSTNSVTDSVQVLRSDPLYGNEIAVSPDIAITEARDIIEERFPGNPPTPESLASIAADLIHGGVVAEVARAVGGDTPDIRAYTADTINTINLRSAGGQKAAIKDSLLSHIASGAVRERPLFPVNVRAPRPPLNEPDAAFANVEPGQSFGSRAAVDMRGRTWAKPVEAALATALKEVMASPSAGLAGIPQGVRDLGWASSEDLIAQYLENIGPVGSVATNPLRVGQSGKELYESVTGDRTTEGLVRMIADNAVVTYAHELAHPAEVGWDTEHGKAFARANALMNSDSDHLIRASDNLAEQLLAMPPAQLQEFLDDATTFSTTHQTFGKPDTLDAAGWPRATAEEAAQPGAQLPDQPQRGPTPPVSGRDVLEGGDQIGPTGRGASRETGNDLRAGAGREEPGGTELRRTDELAGTRGGEAGRAVGTEGTGRGVREPGEAEPRRDTEAAADQVTGENSSFTGDEKYQSGRTHKEEGKSRLWGTLNSEEGSGTAHWTSSILGLGIGAYYGYTTGDTEEEKARNALLYGIGGLIAGNFISGSLAWRLSRRARGKPMDMPEPGESYTYQMKPSELGELRKSMGAMADNTPEQELAHLALVAGLNSRAIDNQQTLIAGINAPIVKLREYYETAFGAPKEGSEQQNLKTGSMKILGHIDTVADEAYRALKHIYDLSADLLPTYNDKVQFLLAFQNPTRWANALRYPETQFTAFGMATILEEWGSMMADQGLISSSAIFDPEGFMYYPQNYITQLYKHLSPEEKLQVIRGENQGGGWSKADIEKARKFDNLADAIMFGLVPADINPPAIVARYINIASHRLAAERMKQMVSEVAHKADEVFVPVSKLVEDTKGQQTVYNIANYVVYDSPLFRNRVDQNDTTKLVSALQTLHKRKVIYDRQQRLAGSHGRKAKEAEDRAYKAAGRMEKLDDTLSDRKKEFDVRKAAREQLLQELRAEGATTLNDVVKAAERRGRAGIQSQEAGLKYGRLQNSLDAMLTKVGELEAKATDEASNPQLDDVQIAALKDSMMGELDNARIQLAEDREPEISSLIESTAEAYDRKEAMKAAAAAGKAHEEKLLKDLRDGLSKQASAKNLEITPNDLKIAQLEGAIKELDFLIQRDLKKSFGSGGKSLGHGEYEQEYIDASRETMEIIEAMRTNVIEPLREKIAFDREPLAIRKDVAPLFAWTTRSPLRGNRITREILEFHSKWVNTLLSGPGGDLFMIGVSSATHTGQMMTGNMTPKQWAGTLGRAYKGAGLAAVSQFGNEDWKYKNRHGIHRARMAGMGMDQRSPDEFHVDPTKPAVETLLGWVPVIGKPYEKLVRASTAAQLEGAVPVIKFENWERRVFQRLGAVLKERGLNFKEDVQKPAAVKVLMAQQADPTGDVDDWGILEQQAMDMGVSQRELDSAKEEAARVMDAYYGGKNWKFSSMSPFAQDILRLVFLAPNWFLTRAHVFGMAVHDLGEMVGTPLETGALKAAETLGREGWERKTNPEWHPFDVHGQAGKDWALGTTMFGVSMLVLSLIGMSSADESWDAKSIRGPDWNYVEEQLRAAFTDPTHFMEVRDPFTGEYVGPLTWQKDFLRVGIATYYMAIGEPEKAWETLGSYGKARLGPLPRTFWNVMLGRSFAGKLISPEGKGPGDLQWIQDQAINFLRENQPQFFSETEKAFPTEMSFTGGTVGQKWGMGYTNPIWAVANMIGLGRARTQTPLDKQFWEDHEATNPDGTPKYPEMQDASGYVHLDPKSKREFLERHPGVHEYLQSGLPSGYREVDEKLKNAADELTSIIESGGKRDGRNYTFSQYREDMKLISAEARGASGTLPFGDKKDPSKEEKLINSYYELFDKASPHGVLDGQLYNDLFESWAAGKTDKELDYVFDYSQIGDATPMAQYSRAIRELKELGAFDIPRNKPESYKSGLTELEMRNWVDDAKAQLVLDDSKEMGMDAVIGYYRKIEGLPPRGALSKEDKAFVDDIVMFMGEPTNKEYDQLRDDHQGLFSWLNSTILYNGILHRMESEDEEIRRRVLGY